MGEFRDWISDNKSKFAAIIVSCAYLIFALFGGIEIVFKLLLFLIFPLACIFFGEAMGGFTGFIGLGRPAITKPTPGCFVVLLGWILLLLPLIAGVIFALSGDK